MYANMKRMNNEMAVSPIVATLVLIVVAVIGAVAVGTIMGTFSTQVSKQANANQANSASQTEILVAGSTTVDPITQAAATLYTALNPGVKVTSQAIASGAGVQAVGNGVADIGAVSEAVKPAWTNQFPNLKTYQIGEGAIAVITNKAAPANITTSIPVAELALFFSTAPAGDGVSINVGAIPVFRADSSGTADSFFQNYLGLSKTYNTNAANVNSTSVNGNAMVVQTVGNTANSLGYADYGDSVANANGAKTIEILPVQDAAANVYFTNKVFDGALGTQTTANWNTLRAEAKYIYQTTVEGATATDPKNYPTTLFRPLSYLTNGQPSASVQNFINFVQTNPMETINGNHYGVFQVTNNFGLADIS